MSQFRIGSVWLKNNLILAPLAGYTDIAFRRLCMELGAGLSVTEMISVKGLCYKNKQTFEMLRTCEAEIPSCVQLFGSDAADFAKALELGVLDNFDIIDVNMGCPVNKVIKNGEGSALLHKPQAAAAIVSELTKSGKPVTVKIRKGFKSDEFVAADFALRMQDAGAAMVTVHGRTTSQLYSGEADYQAVGMVRDALTIPVTLSGDIVDTQSFNERKPYADGFMIGRGALINPSIFAHLQGGELSKKYPLIKRHLRYLGEYFDEHYAVVTIRKFFAYYLKGERGVKEFKNRIYSANSLAQVSDLVDEHLANI